MATVKRIEDKKLIPCEKCGGTYSRLRSCIHNITMLIVSMRMLLGDLWTQELEDKLRESEPYFVTIECGDCGHLKAIERPANSNVPADNDSTADPTKNSDLETESAAD